MDYERDVKGWCAKHITEPEVRWALAQARTCITLMSRLNGIVDPYELAVWRARLPILKTKALLLGIATE